MAFFVQIHKAVHAMPSARFYIIWIIITAAAVIYVVRVVGDAAPPVVRRIENVPIPRMRTPRSFWRGSLIAPGLLALFLACYIALMLRWEDFAYYDDSMFTAGTLMGHDIVPTIVRESGRFFIGGQEFDLMRHFTDANTGYHLLPIAELLLLSYILLILDTELSITARAALAMLALLTPSIIVNFNMLSAPEHNVLFLLACLALSVRRFEQTRSIAWAVTAVVCAQIMIYYKETAFLLLLGFAVGRLILRCRNVREARWDYERLWDEESRLDWCLAALAVLFLLFYFAVMGILALMGTHEGIHGSMGYAVERQQPLREIVFAYLRLDLLAWLFIAVVLGRIYLILRHRVAPSLLWDGLAFGGVACFLGYVVGLRMFGAGYLAPVDLIAVLYVGRFAVLSWNKMRSWGKLATSVLALIILLQDVSFSAFAVFERKNVIHAKAEIASVVKTRYQNSGGGTFRLFFPFASRYVIMEFASYLNYRGVPVTVEGAGAAGQPNSVVLATPALAKDGRCWATGPDFRCRAVSGPSPGDLVIVLPDDEASLADAFVYREKGELLFFYEPYPSIPRWLHSLAVDLVGRLTIAAIRYEHKTLSDRWMDGSVTVWK
jgi:hypothetical protein